MLSVNMMIMIFFGAVRILSKREKKNYNPHNEVCILCKYDSCDILYLYADFIMPYYCPFSYFS